MVKRVSAGVAALVLAAGICSNVVAHAAYSEMTKRLCGAEDGQPLRNCAVVGGIDSIREGDPDGFEVSGQDLSGVSLAVFDASFEDGTWTVGERLTEPFDVEVTDDGAGFVDVETPALSGDRVGGRYFVGPSDMQPGDEGFGDSVWILSERAKLQELTKAPDTDYYDLTIMFGWPDHTYNLQSLINGEWVTWTQTGEGYPALVEDGSAEYELTPPDAPAGNYETRVLNVTTGEPGPVQASVEFGSGQVAPSPSVSSPEPSASVSSPSASSPEPSVSQPSPEPKASGEPGTSQVPTDAPEPSATDSDDVPSPSAESTVRVTATASATERTPKRNDPVGTRKKSTRPGLPRTGVS